MFGMLSRTLGRGKLVPGNLDTAIKLISTSSWHLSAKDIASSARLTVKPQHDSSLDVHDYFGVHKLFTVQDMFEARVHMGHTVTSLDPRMRQFVLGSRFGQCIIDLDQTTILLRQALNFAAHIAYRGGIIMFVTRQPQAVHMVDTTAKECGEYSFTKKWKSDIFCAPSLVFKQEIRLPELLIFLHSRDSHQYAEHQAITDAAKVGIPTIGVVDTDCNPNIISYPIPGNDDTICATEFYLDVFKKAIKLGKQRREEELTS